VPARKRQPKTKVISPEFQESTKLALRERVAYRCSQPECRRPTAGPHTEPTKSTRNGEAAHIRGKQLGSARHDEAMSNAERRDIANGIWLCKNCHKLVDTDWARFPPETLVEWKVKAEERAEQEQYAGLLEEDRHPSQFCELPITWIHDPGDDIDYVRRTQVVARLNEWTSEPSVRTITAHGIAGTGKTSLLGNWLRQKNTPPLRSFAAGLFWSFYSDRDVGALITRVLELIAAHIDFTDLDDRNTPIERFERVARHAPPLLLVLDGIEVLQHGLSEGADYGRLVDSRLQIFLDEIARLRTPWLVISTSRFPLVDRLPYDNDRHIEIGPLEKREALELLEIGGVRGPKPELEQVVSAFAGHPLALKLFSASLNTDLRDRPAEHLAKLLAKVPSDAPFRERLDSLLSYYAASLDSTQSLLLRTLSIFRSPVPIATITRIAAALAGTTNDQEPAHVAASLGKLRSGGIVLRDRDTQGYTYSCHPVVLDTFRAILLGIPEHQRRAIDLLTGRPDEIALEGVSDLEPLIVAIEVLNDSGDTAYARQIYRDRFENGALFLRRGLPFEAIRVFTSFLNPRRPGFQAGGLDDTTVSRVNLNQIEREFLVPAAEFDLALGDLRSARNHLTRAGVVHDWRGRADVHRNFARVLHHEGNPIDAAAAAEKSLQSPGTWSSGSGALRRALALYYRIRSLTCIGEIKTACDALEALYDITSRIDRHEAWVLGPMAALRIFLVDCESSIDSSGQLKQLLTDLAGVQFEQLRLEAMLVAAHAKTTRMSEDATSLLAEVERQAVGGDYKIRRCQASAIGGYSTWLRGSEPDLERLETMTVLAEQANLILVQCELSRVVGIVAADSALGERHMQRSITLAESCGYTTLCAMFPDIKSKKVR